MGTVPRIPTRLYEGETPQAVLRRCHDHTRLHLRAAEDLVAADSKTAPARVIADVASDLREYFGNVLPVHENDECSSVIPALPDDESLDEHLKLIANEHALLKVILSEIDPLWRRLGEDELTLDGLRPELATATRRLVAVFELHHAREEEHLFPRVELLPAATQALLLADMRRRRSESLPS